MSVRAMRRHCLLLTVLALLPTGCERRAKTQPHRPPSDAVDSQDANLSRSRSARAETAPPEETTSITLSLAGEPDKPASGPQPELSGRFRLEKETYCVGEPIFAVFEVTNNGKGPFSFFARGSRANREVQFEVTIEDAAGKRVEPPPLHYSGGRGCRFLLKPSETYVRFFLLSRWARILPPGDYVARAARTLSPDPRSPAKEPTIRGIVRFKVEPYDRKRIKAALLALKQEGEHHARGTQFGKPIRRALEDVGKTFNVSQFEQSIPDGELADKIVSELPTIWDDCYYLEPHLEWNRNWLTADAPEEFALTFSLRNNAPKSLPSGILGSRLSVDGTEIGAWKEMLAAVAGEKRLDRLESGEVVEFSLRFNGYVESGRPSQFTWQIHGRTLRSDCIRFR